MNCPICGKELVQTEHSLGCSGRHDGCTFEIWNTVAGHVLTDEEKGMLIHGGVTDEIRDFRNREGRPFSARLKLDEEGKLIFNFPKRTGQENMKCPVCGKPIRRGKKVWCCMDRECSFVIFNSMAGHFFTEPEKKALLEGEQIGPFNDFISRFGKPFTASVKIGNDGRTQFVFPEKENTSGDSGNSVEAFGGEAL